MNHLIYNIDFELASLLFTVFIFVEVCINYPNQSKQNRIFRYMTLIVIITELFDLASAITNSFASTLPNFVNILMNSGYFMFGLLLCYSFHYYIEVGIVNNENKHSKLLAVSKIVLFVFEALVILNAPFGFFFYFSSDGVYTPGIVYCLLHIASCWFVLCASVSLILNRRSIEKKKLIISLIFIIIYVVAVILQAFIFPRILIIMPAVSAMLIVTVFSLESPDFIKLQNALHELTTIQEQLKESNERNYHLAHTDLMTGINNRTAYNMYLDQLKSTTNNDSLIFLILDINSLKQLNDTFGHIVGDDAIEKTAKLLKENFTKGCRCYRIGGDEFAVIGDNIDKAEFLLCYQNFLSDMQKENASCTYPFSVASGYQIVGSDTIINTLKKADKKMYKDKLSYKKNNNHFYPNET